MTGENRRGHVLIAGVTTRPFAVSAARAGYRVTAIDAFGDLDLRAVAEVILARPNPGQSYGPNEAATAGARVRAKLAAYTSNFENYPAAVTRLSKGRRLLGNGAATLVRVRNPFEVMGALRRHGLVAPISRSRPGSRSFSGPWLMKPIRSGGGHGIRKWSGGQPLPGNMYLQERIVGTPGSLSFAANGSDAVVLGFSRQLVGDYRLAAQRYRYCGSILGSAEVRLFSRQRELLERAAHMATTLTREFGLVGLNGIDFIARGGLPYPIEVNPRYSASMELIERAHGISMFQTHARACQGVLPAALDSPRAVHGKAIVFAREETLTVDLWQRVPWIADVPHPGERIPRGRPVCTVFAEARDPEACRRLLWRRAAAIYRAVKSPKQRAA